MMDFPMETLYPSKLLTLSSESFSQKIASWTLSLDNLLEDADGIRAFYEFLKKDQANEKLDFLLDCRTLRSLTQPKEIRMKVRIMYSTYFALAAPKVIVIDEDAQLAADEDVLCPSGSSFKEAQDFVYNLLKDDAYPRFLEFASQAVKGPIAVKTKTRKGSFHFSRYRSTLKHLKWRGI